MMAIRLLVCLLFTGCAVEGIPAQTVQEYEMQPEVVKIVTVDNITLYRTYDGGQYIYFSGKGTQKTVCTPVGKTIICHDHQVPNSDGEG